MGRYSEQQLREFCYMGASHKPDDPKPQEQHAAPAFNPSNVRAWMLATPFTICEAWKDYVEHMIASLTQMRR